MEEKFMTVTISIVMQRDECQRILRQNQLDWSDFDNEDEAFIWAAEEKYNEGNGVYVK